jgi:hypothetical protein
MFIEQNADSRLHPSSKLFVKIMFAAAEAVKAETDKRLKLKLKINHQRSRLLNAQWCLADSIKQIVDNGHHSSDWRVEATWWWSTSDTC